MDSILQAELERLTKNAAMRREDLLDSGLGRSKRKKQFTILAGILALTSAATITAFMTKLFGTGGMQAISAFVALMSGTISLVVTAHYSDDEVVGRLAGASKYLGLRDSVFRLVIDPDTTDKQKRKALAALQAEYTSLDATYSKYFTCGTKSKTAVRAVRNYLPSMSSRDFDPDELELPYEATVAADEDIRQLHQTIERSSQ